MADFVAPQFQNPDLLKSYVQGQQAAYQPALAQQQLTEGQLNIDQLRTTLRGQQMTQDLASRVGQGAQSQGGGTGGVQNGPPGSVPADGSSPGSSGYSMDPRITAQLAILHNQDPNKAIQESMQTDQMRKKIALQGPMNLAETVATSADANKIVNNNPSLKAGWNQYAPMFGIDPNDPTQLTVENAQKVAGLYYNTLAGQAGEPTKDFGFSGILKPGEAAYHNSQIVAGSPDAMTPYQQQEIALRKQDIAMRGSERAKPQLVDVPMPDGTTQKQWVVPGHDQGTNVGAPEAAKPGQGMGRVQQMVGRLTLAGNEVATSAENLMKLGINTDSGWLGLASPQHGGILSSMKNALTNVVSKEDTKSYGIMVSGVKRNLAAIEAAGNMPPGSLTAQMDQVELKPGDTQINKLQRMAEIRQISQAGLESILTQPGLSQQQIAQIKGINDRMAKAIPFTQADILNLQQSKDPHATISNIAKNTGVQDVADAAHPPAVQSLLDKYK